MKCPANLRPPFTALPALALLLILPLETPTAGEAVANQTGAPSDSQNGKPLPAITIDYPEDQSIFPPEITAPTFIWHDPAENSASWRIDISFADGSPAIHAKSQGERLRIGEIDPNCVSSTNELPKLTPRQATARTWTPDPAIWEIIKRRSTAGPATVSITGLGAASPIRPVSVGSTRIQASADPVGAPIFYRDVPLMPTETEQGVIEPLSAFAVRLVNWRIRNIGEHHSRVVMENVPVCANCHSFSADGKTMGMDLDGLQSNRGLYILSQVKPEMSIRNDDVIQWRTASNELRGRVRVGFMSQVSPDSQYVVTTVNDAALEGAAQEPVNSASVPSNYYTANFRDYRFLQVFYPTRGVLCWYSRTEGMLKPLPGADDPRFVQMGAVWSPDGGYLVFARAGARDPNAPGTPAAEFAMDPDELQIRYDLYRIPFNAGKGGTPTPIAGASNNGISNSFPKVSPDGRWIVFVQSRNGLLMRPDSQLYIVPASGGQARRMRCNTVLMNSWHSFSPNGRWLVFSSKSRSPYTQLYLTHIDPEGNDSPAILIDNTTASNRAANIPEFVNIAPNKLRRVDGAAIEFYRLFDRAAYLQKTRQYAESITAYKQALELKPNEALAHKNLSMVLLLAGRPQEAAAEFQKATEINLRRALEIEPSHAPSHSDLGKILLQTGAVSEAIVEFRKSVDLMPESAEMHSNLGRALAMAGDFDEALAHLNMALDLDGGFAAAHFNRGLIFSMRGETEASIREWQKALTIDPKSIETHNCLADALHGQRKTAEALEHWREAMKLQPNNVRALQRIAWLRATGTDQKIRNGGEAVVFARRAVRLTSGNDAAALDTLAAAYAETGMFVEAAQTARQALALASQKNAQALRRAIWGRIALYEARKPFREDRGTSVHP